MMAPELLQRIIEDYSARAMHYTAEKRPCHPLCARQTEHEGCQIDPAAAEIADAAEAAKYVPTTPLPLSDENRAMAEKMAAEIFAESAQITSRKCMDCGGEADPPYGAGYRPDAPITSSMVICWSCRDKAVATREPKQAESERCNATYQGYVECSRFARHSNSEHVSADGCRWQDGWLGAKPHEPARKEPGPQATATCPLCCVGTVTQEAADLYGHECEFQALAENIASSLADDVERLTKERDEARGSAYMFRKQAQDALKERDEAWAEAESANFGRDSALEMVASLAKELKNAR
jgi:hypothetical protein